MKKLLIFFLLVSKVIIAQNIPVSSDDKILNLGEKYYYPIISQDGKKIAFTTQNFKGLYVFDFKTKKIIQVSDKSGAGYKPVFSDDSKNIYFRSNEYVGIKKYSTIFGYNLKNDTKSVIGKRSRDMLPPKVINNILVYEEGGNIKTKQISKMERNSPEPLIYTYIENQKIVVFKNGVKTILTPKGAGNYIWPELSPDKTKLLFTFAGHGTFICDLKGNILADIGYLNASKWLNNNWVIGMKDHDNGDVFTESDIYAVGINGNETVQLTNTVDEIEMYPDCSADGTKIVYHTLDGNIHLMTVNYK